MNSRFRSASVSFMVQPLEARRLLAGVAPASVVGYHLSLYFDESGAFASSGSSDVWISPVSNFCLFANAWWGTYTYEKISDSVGEGTLSFPFVGTLKAVLTFTDADAGSIRLSKKHTVQRGEFFTESTTPEIFHFTGDEEDEDPGQLIVYGTNGNDTINATLLDDGTLHIDCDGSVREIAADLVNTLEIATGDGNDKITIGPGVQVPDPFNIDPDSPVGADIIAGGGNDTVLGGDGWDRISGGSGKDLLRGGAGDDTIDGNTHSDVIFGDAGNDRINGNDGDDRIDGGAGKDRINGGNHNDSILGGSQNDILYGDAGDDTIDGGTHNDRVTGGDGKDRIAGGAGDDVLFSDDAVADVLNGGIGNDTSYGDSEDSIDLVEHLL